MPALTRLSARGQCVIPAGVRAAKGWTQGTVLDVIDEGPGRVALVERAPANNPFGPPLTVDEYLASPPPCEGPYVTDAMIREGLARDAAERYERKMRP